MKHLISLFLILLLIPLTSCQNTPPDEAAVPKQANTTLEAFDLTTEDWQTLEGEGVSLSLPASYRGGNPNRDITEIKSTLANVNSNYSERLQAVQQNLEGIALIAFDTQFFEADSLTNVNVMQKALAEAINLDNFLSQTVRELEATHNITEQDIINQNNSSLGRILTTVTTEKGQDMTQLFYLQPQAETMWITTYTTPSSEFDQRVKNFEESIATLEIPAVNRQ